jgi:hypothetical protein
MKEIKVPVSLIYAHFIFTDIAGISSIPVEQQIQKIKKLSQIVESCEIMKNVDPSSMIILPVGDGICIGFLQGPELPLMLAIELHSKIKEHNKNKPPEEQLGIRIGLNDGPVYVVRDIMGDQNIWGPGIIIARRVMDIGDKGHILVSQRMAETLRELSDEYKMLIKPLHDYTFKHGLTMLLYSIYGNGIGNPATPTKNLSQKSKAMKVLQELRLYALYEKLDVSLEIKNTDTMLMHHKRIYHIRSASNEPIETVWHGIGTDVPKSFNDLNIRVTDEAGRELKITSINFDKPFQKEFTTSFIKHIYKKQTGSYTVEYDVEEPERYFENYFAVNCKKFTISLIYDQDAGLKPTVYNVNVEKEMKTKSTTPLKTTKLDNNRIISTWTKSNVMQGQSFRIEW